MELSSKAKSVVPHLIAVILFTVISFAFFHPVLEGKRLKANDSTVHLVNSKEIQDYRDKYGKEPLWTNSIFGGMPAYLISTRYPGNLIKYVDFVLRQYAMPVSVLFISLLGFYILLIIFGLGPWLSMVGAIAYGFTSFFFQMLAAGHNTQAIAFAYIPPLIGSIWYAFRHNAVKGAVLTALFLALEIQANHPQMTYYAMLCVLIFGIVELIYSFRNKTLPSFLKTTLILIVPVIIAIGINFASLYTTWEYGKYSIRGKSDLVVDNHNMTKGLDKNYILNWSYGVGETFNMLIPNWKGGSSRPFDKDSELYNALRQNKATQYANDFQKYWGTQPGTEGPHYVGAIIVFLFVTGLFLIKGPEKWWLLAATILSIMLAWGKNFMPLSNLFIDFFPGYNKFRAVTMILIVAEFCIPLLGFLALRDIFNGSVKREEILRSIKMGGGITAGFILLALVIPGIAGSFLASYETGPGLPDWIKNALIADRKNLLRADAFRSLVFILLSAGVIVAFLYNKLRSTPAIILLGLFILVDLWTVGKRYLNADRFERPAAISKSFTPSAADSYILNDKSIKRVLNLSVSTFNDNSPTSWFHHSVGGYHGAKMKRYQEFIDTALIPNINILAAGKSLEDVQNAFRNTYAFNMLNTRYVIVSPDAQPIINDRALGNAWFVEKPVIVENANEEFSRLNLFDPAAEALIDKKFSSQVTGESFPESAGDTISLTSYLPNELVYRYKAAAEKLVVFSEIYYPEGWKVFIDGNESSHFRADYILRAMIVPAGEHEIKFIFEPASYKTGNTISLASSILLLLAIAGYIGSSLIRNKQGNSI